ncbi:MAG TPA: LptA/OstA family protein [Acidisoma sp.]|uniref:LptA/OstA family protein n=1 Tax=Acidisoma sp. TaxID=1872115 RepID=UPI002B9C6B2D|nr:LptA/OstA family protein [Acidisoma sp.]HTH99984.1 LptA/OstA family protein [Acidisoma sp.]
MTSKVSRARRAWAPCGVGLLGLVWTVMGGAAPASAQAIDLNHGGPVTVTSEGGIEWRQKSQEVIADQDAKAVRGNVTVTANQLIAHYRKKGGTAAAPTQSQGSTAAPADQSGGLEGNNEIYLLEALGNVHIFTPTDQAWGDHGAYDMDQGVLVLTGHDLKLTTPRYVVTARDSLEYWSNQHMAVARGNAVLVTDTGRRIAADVLVAYTDADAPASGGQATAGARTDVALKTAPATSGTQGANDPSGKLKRVDAIGHVVVMTATEIVQGDRAVYDPGLGIARIAGNVRITRGQNVLAGDEALVNMKTGIARLLSTGDAQVKGLIIPNQASQAVGAAPTAPAARQAAH